MIKTNWQKGTLVEPAKVLSDGSIQPAQYEGATPLSPEMLNQMEDNIESAILETENEINNKFEWKFWKSVTGKTPISLPENFNELFICCNLNKDHYTNIIPKVILSTTSKNFNINGRKTSSSYGAGVTSDISLSSYVLRFLYSNDVDRSQETTSTIYYR